MGRAAVAVPTPVCDQRACAFVREW